jgi:hypothetical protein
MTLAQFWESTRHVRYPGGLLALASFRWGCQGEACWYTEGVFNLEKEAIIFVVVSNSVAAPKHVVLTTDAGTPTLPTRSVLMNILDPLHMPIQ